MNLKEFAPARTKFFVQTEIDGTQFGKVIEPVLMSALNERMLKMLNIMGRFVNGDDSIPLAYKSLLNKEENYLLWDHIFDVTEDGHHMSWFFERLGKGICPVPPRNGSSSRMHNMISEIFRDALIAASLDQARFQEPIASVVNQHLKQFYYANEMEAKRPFENCPLNSFWTTVVIGGATGTHFDAIYQLYLEDKWIDKGDPRKFDIPHLSAHGLRKVVNQFIGSYRRGDDYKFMKHGYHAIHNYWEASATEETNHTGTSLEDDRFISTSRMIGFQDLWMHVYTFNLLLSCVHMYWANFTLHIDSDPDFVLTSCKTFKGDNKWFDLYAKTIKIRPQVDDLERCNKTLFVDGWGGTGRGIL